MEASQGFNWSQDSNFSYICFKDLRGVCVCVCTMTNIVISMSFMKTAILFRCKQFPKSKEKYPETSF